MLRRREESYATSLSQELKLDVTDKFGDKFLHIRSCTWRKEVLVKTWWFQALMNEFKFYGDFQEEMIVQSVSFGNEFTALWIYEDQVVALWYKSRVLIQQVQEATAVDILRVVKEDSDTSVVDIWTKVMGLMLDVLVIKGLRDRVWLGKGSFQQLALMELPPGST